MPSIFLSCGIVNGSSPVAGRELQSSDLENNANGNRWVYSSSCVDRSARGFQAGSYVQIFAIPPHWTYPIQESASESGVPVGGSISWIGRGFASCGTNRKENDMTNLPKGTKARLRIELCIVLFVLSLLVESYHGLHGFTRVVRVGALPVRENAGDTCLERESPGVERSWGLAP